MPDGERQDDLTLLLRTAAGERRAFDALVTRHQGAVMAVTRALTRDEAAAEDAFQDALLAAYRNATKFRGESSVKTWIISIARNAALRQGRRQVGEPARFDDLGALGALAGWGDPEQTPEAAAARAEERDRVWRALATLPEPDREVLALRDLAGLDGPEAAAALGLTVAAMKTRLHRSRLRLMAALSRGGGHGA